MVSGIAPSMVSKRGSSRELIPIFPITLERSSSPANERPPFVEYVVFGGQFCASHSRRLSTILQI